MCTAPLSHSPAKQIHELFCILSHTCFTHNLLCLQHLTPIHNEVSCEQHGVCVCVRECKAVSLISLLSILYSYASISSEGHGSRTEHCLDGLSIMLHFCRSSECVSLQAFCGFTHFSNTRAISLNKHNLITDWQCGCSLK